MSRTHSWSVWSDWLRFQIESGGRSIAMWWTTGVGNCSPSEVWSVLSELFQRNRSSDGSWSIYGSDLFLIGLEDSLTSVVNEPPFVRFWSGIDFWLISWESLVSLVSLKIGQVFLVTPSPLGVVRWILIDSRSSAVTTSVECVTSWLMYIYYIENYPLCQMPLTHCLRQRRRSYFMSHFYLCKFL